MKTQGNVHSVVIGGRPLYSPMQAVGGAKGCEKRVAKQFRALLMIMQCREPRRDRYQSSRVYN